MEQVDAQYKIEPKTWWGHFWKMLHNIERRQRPYTSTFWFGESKPDSWPVVVNVRVKLKLLSATATTQNWYIIYDTYMYIYEYAIYVLQIMG